MFTSLLESSLERLRFIMTEQLSSAEIVRVGIPLVNSVATSVVVEWKAVGCNRS